MRRAASAIAIVSSTMLTSAAARGQTPSSNDDERRMQAQSLLDQAQKVVANDPKGALSALRASYDVEPDFRVLYNIGVVCDRLADAPCAWRSFDAYLREGGDKVPAKRKKEVEGRLKTLTRPGTLAITTSALDAEVRIDGTSAGRTPLAKPVAVAPGEHVVTLVVPGSSPVERKVRVGSGETQKLEVEAPTENAERSAAAAPPPAPAPAKSEPAPAHHDARRSAPVLPWVITGALAAGTVTAGIFTQRMNAHYAALSNAYPVSRDELDGAYGKTKNLLMLTGALGGATLIALGIATYKTIFRGAAIPSEKERTVDVAIGPSGIAVGGTL